MHPHPGAVQLTKSSRISIIRDDSQATETTACLVDVIGTWQSRKSILFINWDELRLLRCSPRGICLFSGIE